MAADVKRWESAEFLLCFVFSASDLKPAYGSALAHCVSASVSFSVCTSILCALNAGQRAEKGICKRNKGGGKSTEREIEEGFWGEKLGGKGGKVREDHSYESA